MAIQRTLWRDPWYPDPIQSRTYKPINPNPYSPTQPAPAPTPAAPTPNPYPAYTPPSEADAWSAAQSRSQDILGPLLQLLQQQQAQEEAQARAQKDASVQAITAAWEKAQPQLAEVYNNAISQASMIENAISNRLGGVATEGTNAFAQKLAQINAPDQAGQVEKLKQMYSGANNAEYARGMNDVARMVAQGASAREYAAEQPGIGAQQAEADLAQQLQDLAKTYGGQRDELVAHMPEQVQSLFESIYGQRSDAAKTAYDALQQQYQTSTEASRYKDQQTLDAQKFAYQKSQDIKDRMDARHKLELEQRLAAQQTMTKLQYQKWAKQQDLRSKALDRQAQAEMKQYTEGQQNQRAQLQAETTRRGQDMTAATARTKKNQAAKNNKNKSETVATPGSAKRERVVQGVWSAVTNPQTGRIADRIMYAINPDNKARQLINGALQARGVDPNSPQGYQIRRSILRRMDGMKIQAKDGSTLTFHAPKDM